MCVRYVGVDAREERIAERLAELHLSFDRSLGGGELFPGGSGSFAKRMEDGAETAPGTWGLTPFWAKKKNFGKLHAYNARSEGSEEKAQGIEKMPTFREAFKSRRGLVPAAAFYERANGRWLKITPGHDSLFAIASLWEPANEHTAGSETYTLVTTEPNASMSEVHDRMPVILDPDSIGDWMAEDAPIELLRSLMVPCPCEWVTIEDAGPIGRKKAVAETLF